MTVEYDHHAPEFAENWRRVYSDLRKRCPVAHTDAHGGYYVITTYEDVVRVGRDWETFSSDKDLEGRTQGRPGIMIPPYPARLSIGEMDPPDSTNYRKVLVPRFSVAAVEAFAPAVRRHTHEAIDGFIARGKADLVEELANVVPARSTLEFMGMPTGESHRYADIMHKAVFLDQSEPAYQEVLAGLGWVIEQLAETIADHHASPADDLISYLLDAEVAGEKMSDQTVLEMLFVHLTGGLDTTTALIALGLHHLDTHPADRARLIADPSLLPGAVDEFMRFYCPSTGIARTVTRDTELSGVKLTTGDRVFLAWGAANHDESRFPDADRVVLDRKPNPHLGFGTGVHRCVGLNLARAEAVIVLGAVLERLPDYRIDHNGTHRYPSIGIANSYIQMPATFTPGPRLVGSGS